MLTVNFLYGLVTTCSALTSYDNLSHSTSRTTTSLSALASVIVFGTRYHGMGAITAIN